MNILKEFPEAHTLETSGTTDSASDTQDRTEASGMTDSKPGTQDRTEASGTIDSEPGTQDLTEVSGTGDVTRDRNDVRQARASHREGHNPMPKRHIKKETKREAPPRKKALKQEE